MRPDTINKRSTTSTRKIDEIIGEIFERSKAILAKNPPFDVKSNIPHIDNVRKLSTANGSFAVKQHPVYIYENNKMVKGSPFASYSAAASQ